MYSNIPDCYNGRFFYLQNCSMPKIKQIDIAILHINISNHQLLLKSINLVTQCNYLGALTLKRTVKVVLVAKYIH